MAEALKVQLYEVSEPHNKLMDILHSSTSAKVALPVNEVPRACYDHMANPGVHPSNMQAEGQEVLGACKGYRFFYSLICLQITSQWTQSIRGVANTNLNLPHVTEMGCAWTCLAEKFLGSELSVPTSQIRLSELYKIKPLY